MASKRVAMLGVNMFHYDTLAPSFGGGERYTGMLVDMLVHDGYAVDLYQMVAPGRRLDSTWHGVRVRGIEGRASCGEWQCSICDDFTDIAERGGYDHVMHVLPEASSGRLRDDAIVVWHGIWFDDGRVTSTTKDWWLHLRQAVRSAAHIVSVDQNSLNVVRALCGTGIDSKSTVILNAVDVAHYDRGRKAQWATPPRILFPRRACVPRGSRLFEPILHALADVPCEVRWIGSTEILESALMRKICERDARASFAVVPFEHMAQQYAWADICVIPTLHSEGTSLSCLEAMAAGRAVIATRVGGLPELIRDGENGWCVPPTTEAIAAAICEALWDARTANERAAVAQADVYARHTLEQWQQQWRSVLTTQWGGYG